MITTWIVLALIAVTITGIYKGYKKSWTFYQNKKDLYVGMTLALLTIITLFFTLVDQHKPTLYSFWVTFWVGIIYQVALSIIVNRDKWYAIPVIMIGRLTLHFLIPIITLMSICSGGSRATDQSHSDSIIRWIFVGVILYGAYKFCIALVKDNYDNPEIVRG